MNHLNTVYCGPHCGIKDGVDRHCQLCHGEHERAMISRPQHGSQPAETDALLAAYPKGLPYATKEDRVAQ